METESKKPVRVVSVERGTGLEMAGFDGLLAVLDADRERAGERYERLRRLLIHFFEWSGSSFPEDLADRTIDRVTQKIARGEWSGSTDILPYLHAVARNILKEHWRERKRESVALRGLFRFENSSAQRDGFFVTAAESADLERRSRCLEICLKTLSPESRGLILSYYHGKGQVKIENRKALAKRFGIALPALRNRSQRLRWRLESCIEECLKKTAGYRSAADIIKREADGEGNG